MVLNISGQFYVSCPSCGPSQLLVHTHPTHWEWGKHLDTVQAMLSNSYNAILLPYSFSHKSKIR